MSIQERRGFLPHEGLKYTITGKGVQKLNTFVDDLERDPKNSRTLVGKTEFEDALTFFDKNAVIKSLPEGFSEQDLVGVLSLAFYTECATILQV